MPAQLKSSPRRPKSEPLLRDAVRTKNAIFEAARKCFSAESYERVTTRKIASTAGVNHSLISKYFGSKEGLFRELIADVMHLSDIPDIEVELARIVASIASGGKDPNSGRRVLFRSSNSPLAGRIFKEFLENRYIPALSAQVPGSDAALKVELALSLIHGAIVFQRLGLPRLAHPDAELQDRLLGELRRILRLESPSPDVIRSGHCQKDIAGRTGPG